MAFVDSGSEISLVNDDTAECTIENDLTTRAKDKSITDGAAETLPEASIFRLYGENSLYVTDSASLESLMLIGVDL